ncbi:MAG: sensor histidine kinase [Winogradskyella sp.]
MLDYIIIRYLIVGFCLLLFTCSKEESEVYQFNSDKELDKLLKIAYDNCDGPDSLLFRKTNKIILDKSYILKDTLIRAEAYWNYGIFYSRKEQLDSSYFHYNQAYNLYKLIGHEYYRAKMLYNMAYVHSKLKDYLSAEEKLFEAISLYKRLKKYNALYTSYKFAGDIYLEKKELDKAMDYQNKALEVLSKIDKKGVLYEKSLNSIGLIYQAKQNYNKAIFYFEQNLRNKELKNLDINHFARVTDNLAYAKLLNNDTLGVKDLLFTSLKVRDSVENLGGVIINKIHIAEYYLIKKDSSKALIYASDALKKARDITNRDNVLTSLKLLANIDPVNSSKYLEEYIELSQELRMYENNLRNKFARIRFETDEYIEENEKLTLRNTITLIGTIVIIIVLSLLYFLRVQRSKTRTLLLEKEQQLANEEIYKLMLRQKNTLEEGRLKERQRISEELHDGILGKIFSTRIGLGFLNFDASKEDMEKHEEYIDNLQTIEKEIRDISHDLKSELLSSKSNYISLIEDLIIERSNLFDFNYKIEKNDTSFWNDASNTIKVNIYRIIQELLQNMVKHAEANNICINFDYVDDSLMLRVEDDGQGFNTENKTRGIGLTNIDQRINSINGELRITSKIGSGTVTEIKIPFN